MYRTADLGDELATLDHEPAGCAVYFFGLVSASMGLSVIGVLALAMLLEGLPDVAPMLVALSVGLVFLLPGLGVCVNSWSRARERVSYVLHERALVRRSRRGTLVVQWRNIEKITRIHMPSSTDTFIIETSCGQRLEMSSAYLKGVTARISKLLGDLTGLAIERLPGGLREQD